MVRFAWPRQCKADSTPAGCGTKKDGEQCWHLPFSLSDQRILLGEEDHATAKVPNSNQVARFCRGAPLEEEVAYYPIRVGDIALTSDHHARSSFVFGARHY